MKTNLYIPRSYRNFCLNKRFVRFEIRQKESDLFILAKSELIVQAHKTLSELRAQIESYIEIDKNFLTSLKPIEILDSAPEIVKEMARASKKFGVGPMASIAGVLSERVCRNLLQYSDEVIVENGGDIYIINKEPVTLAIYAGHSPLSMKIGIEIDAHPEGIAVATSSGTVGHSLSFGNADAVTVVSKNGSFADAAATAICNMVKTKDDIEKALNFASGHSEICGLVIIMEEQIGVVGKSIRLKIIDVN
ncbi:MAG: UPF0280 family protein [candidate division WOR-3 bacterium]